MWNTWNHLRPHPRNDRTTQRNSPRTAGSCDQRNRITDHADEDQHDPHTSRSPPSQDRGSLSKPWPAGRSPRERRRSARLAARSPRDGVDSARAQVFKTPTIRGRRGGGWIQCGLAGEGVPGRMSGRTDGFRKPRKRFRATYTPGPPKPTMSTRPSPVMSARNRGWQEPGVLLGRAQPLVDPKPSRTYRGRTEPRQEHPGHGVTPRPCGSPLRPTLRAWRAARPVPDSRSAASP